jgi:Family of unknown function (DUF5313)
MGWAPGARSSGSSAVFRSPGHPGPVRWLWYALGGRLPAAYRDWVLYDVTCRTWPLRHLARLLVQLVPVAVVLMALLPGPIWVRSMAVIGGSLVGLLYSFVFLYEATEHRACKAGFPHATAARVREERRAARSLAAAVRDFDRYRRRFRW